MSKEIFKDIPGYEGYYQASNLGNVKSMDRKDCIGRVINERILKHGVDGGGYLMVVLHKNRKFKIKRVHKLVAMAFLGHKPDGYNLVVDHKNNVRTDNRLGNLQIITNRENISKDMENCSSNYTGVSWNKNSEKWRSYIYINGKQTHLGLFKTELEASEVYQAKLTTL